MVNFSDNSDLRRGFKASLRDFWDSRKIKEGQQKAIDMFLKVTMSPFGYQLAIEHLKYIKQR